jgi:hypothetical protein
MNPSTARARSFLGALLTLAALLAFAVGYYGMIGAPDAPRTWLDGLPFASYFVPGLVLFLLIGGVSTLAALAVLTEAPWARAAATVTGTVVLAWTLAPLSLASHVPLVAPLAATLALAVLILGTHLPGGSASEAPARSR